jgi:hypothetical protein
MENPISPAETSVTESQGAVRALLREVANLCVLGHITQDDATSIFRDALHRASASLTTPPCDEVDAFVAAQALGEWHTNTRFLDRYGGPASLSISAGEFTALCQTASAEADHMSVLDFLQQADAVSVNGDIVRATRRDLLLGFGHPGAVARAIRLATGFSRTLNRNLTCSLIQPNCFERTVVNTKLAKRQLPALHAYLSVHGQSFLEDLDSWMSSRESNVDGPRVGVGLYLFEGESPR